MGATYTRQSSSGITDGAVIEAADINAEFDELLAAFVAASGHTHDGTAAEGGPVTSLLGTAITIGNATSGTDITVTFDGETSDGVLTWMEDEDYFKFSDDILILDNEKLIFGTDENITVTYDESTNDALEIAANVEGAGLPIILKADQGDDAGDEWKLNVADGGVITLGNDINSAGTYVTHLTITPNSTVANSTVAFAGKVTIPDAGNIGSASDTDAIAISSAGVVALSATTAASATTTAALTVAGGLGVAGDIWLGDDLVLDSDSAVFSLGADQDVTITHVADTGLNIKNTSTSGNSGIGTVLTLQTGDTDIAATNILGEIKFQAPDEGTGTDALLIAASIAAVSEGNFAADNNATKLSFKTAASEAASEKMALSSGGVLTVSGGLVLSTVAAAGTDTDKFLVLDGSGNVDYRTGTQVASDIGAATSAPSLSGSTDNTIVTVTGANAIAGEANFTYDSTDAALTSGTSNKPVFSFTNTNTDANGSILKFIKDAGEAGAANDISGLISFYADDADQNNQEFGRITGRVVDATSGGEEGALDFYVAEYDGTVTKGMEIKGLASDGNITVDISTHDGTAGGLMLGSTLVTSTATELNLMDGGTSAGTTAVASGDGIVTNDGGTMRQTTLDTFDTYLSASTKTLTNKTLTAPKFADAGYIADASGNELIILQTTGSAINQFDVANAAADNDPTITATGGDANVGLGLVAKGTGVVQITSTMNPTITTTGKALVMGF